MYIGNKTEILWFNCFSIEWYESIRNQWPWRSWSWWANPYINPPLYPWLATTKFNSDVLYDVFLSKKFQDLVHSEHESDQDEENESTDKKRSPIDANKGLEQNSSPSRGHSGLEDEDSIDSLINKFKHKDNSQLSGISLSVLLFGYWYTLLDVELVLLIHRTIDLLNKKELNKNNEESDDSGYDNKKRKVEEWFFCVCSNFYHLVAFIFVFMLIIPFLLLLLNINV